MKNFAKFLLFVLLVSAGISLLYDYRLKHGGLNLPSGRKPEKYTLASNSSVDPKQVPSLEALNRERRALVKSQKKSVSDGNTDLIRSSSFSRTDGNFVVRVMRLLCKTRSAPA
jgi:hypothetical protein